jgi:hypothetical protein
MRRGRDWREWRWPGGRGSCLRGFWLECGLWWGMEGGWSRVDGVASPVVEEQRSAASRFLLGSRSRRLNRHSPRHSSRGRGEQDMNAERR